MTTTPPHNTKERHLIASLQARMSCSESVENVGDLAV